MEFKSVKTKDKKRPGRGISAGQGKTAGRGTKGQKSRAGHNIPNRHEGGQTPLSMRLPKLGGFKSKKPKAEVVSLDVISKNYKDGEVVSLETLVEKNLVSGKFPVKVLNNGELSVKVTVEGVNVSKSAEDKFAKKEAKAEKPAEKPAKKVSEKKTTSKAK